MMIEAEMYGMMPEREDREARQRAAREHVEHVQDAALLRAGTARASTRRIDARHRDVRADAVDDQRAEQEQQPALQIAAACPDAPRREVFVGQLSSLSLRWLALLLQLAGAASTRLDACRRRLRSPRARPW